jgi:WD40 repeat protein
MIRKQEGASMRLFRYFFLFLGFVGLTTAQIELLAQEPETVVEIAYDLDWRPDGSTLAVAGNNHLWLLSAEFQTVKAYLYPTLPDGMMSLPRAVEWSPDGEWLATIHQGGWLRVWSYPSGKLVFDQQLTDREDPDTIRWHPHQPLLSTYNQVVNVQSGIIEQPFTYDVYWGRSTNDPPLEQHLTGKVFWSSDDKWLIRKVSDAGCSPCSEYGLFDVVSGALDHSLGTDSGAWDNFIWSADNRYRVIDHVLIGDLLFDSQIERIVYLETGNYQFYRMPAMFVVNSFEDTDVINHQVVYPISLLHIDWTPNTPYEVTAINCAGEILRIDIRDLSVVEKAAIFAPYALSNETSCEGSVFPGYTNP